MTLPLNQIVCGDNCDVMRGFPSECIDLVVTSPPYDSLRTYGGHTWDFYGVAWNLSRILKPGGVIAWVVGDEVIDGSESGTSFEQALHFKRLGLLLHDTMIYQRQGQFPDPKRYWQNFEYVFILSKGRPKTVNLLKDRPNANRRMGGHTMRERDGTLTKVEGKKVKFDEFGIRSNIWEYGVGKNNSTKDAIATNHPAIFPEKLATDHILTWSNESEVVLDPFSGSGTTAKSANQNARHYIGIEINSDYCDIAKERLSQKVLFGTR